MKNIASHQRLIDKFYICLQDLQFINHDTNYFDVEKNEILLLTAVSESSCRWLTYDNYHYFEFTFVSIESFEEKKLKLYHAYTSYLSIDANIQNHIISNLDFFEQSFKDI